MSFATRAHEPGTTARKPDAGGLLTAAYAAVVYLLFLAVLCYSVGFFADAGVPKTIDDGPRGPVLLAVVVDLLLLNLFAGQHTLMARPWFKRVWTRIVPEPAERATFVLAATLVQALLFWQWRPIGATVWHTHGAAAIVLRAVFVLGWAIAIGSTYLINHADLFGLRQAIFRLRGAAYEPVPVVEGSVYSRVRHPLMTGFLIVFWAAPVMSAGHLLFAIASTAYVLVGIGFEERDLITTFGQTYLDYRGRVPALVPLRWKRRARG